MTGWYAVVPVNELVGHDEPDEGVIGFNPTTLIEDIHMAGDSADSWTSERGGAACFGLVTLATRSAFCSSALANQQLGFLCASIG